MNTLIRFAYTLAFVQWVLPFASGTPTDTEIVSDADYLLHTNRLAPISPKDFAQIGQEAHGDDTAIKASVAAWYKKNYEFDPATT